MAAPFHLEDRSVLIRQGRSFVDRTAAMLRRPSVVSVNNTRSASCGHESNTYSLSNALIVALFRHALFVTGLFRLTLIAMVLMIALVLSRRILRFNFSAEGRTNRGRARTFAGASA